MQSPHKSKEELEFLARLGQRVRETRAAAGVNRKQLAQRSGLSERYLAQLEGGEGNISILLIRRVATALGTDAVRLISESPPEVGFAGLMHLLKTLDADQLAHAAELLAKRFRPGDDSRRDRIALIGLRGAGKSTLGARLAAESKLPFVEFDQEIEREVGASLQNIFTVYGQDTYRDAERRVLERLLAEQPRFVLATGGSLVLQTATYARLREHCFTVWLKATPSDHMQRVIAQGDLRPFEGRANAEAELHAILRQREGLYALADATIDTSALDVDKAAQALLAAVRRA